MSNEQSEIRSKLGLDKKKRVPRWIIATAFFVLFGGLIWNIGHSASKRSNSLYQTINATRSDLVITINATGSLEPTEIVDISSELSGTVADVLVDFNDAVEEGQLLARLNTEKLEALVAVQEATLRAAVARLARAGATLDEARLNAERLQVLGQRGIATEESVIAADAAFARAIADLEVAEADVAVANANLRLAETDLSNAFIRSPVEGVILDRNINPGQTISAAMSAPVLFTIAEDLREMELSLAVDEADVAGLEIGQQATFEVDAHTDKLFAANVVEVRFASESIDGIVTYTVILEIANEDLLLRPGMTAVADVVVSTVSGALLVPNAALRFAPRLEVKTDDDSDQGGGLLGMLLPAPPERTSAERSPSTLWVLRGDKPVEIQIVRGATDGKFTEIRDGLQEGDAVIVGQDG